MASTQGSIQHACETGDLSTARNLYAALSPSEQQSSLFDMILIASRTGAAAIVQFCIDHGAAITWVVTNEATKFPEVCKIPTTAGGMDINEDWETAGDILIDAVWERNITFAKWLLKHGADPNSGHAMDGSSAIAAAAELGRLDLAQLLVAYKTNVSGTGALSAAAGKGHVDMVRYLLVQGADVDELGVHCLEHSRKRAEEGTGLHKAAGRGDMKMAEPLIERGAKIDARDPLGRTASEWAREARQEGMVRYLEGLVDD